MTIPWLKITDKSNKNDDANHKNSSSIVCLALFFSVALLTGLWSWTLYAWHSKFYYEIDTLKPVCNVSKEFLSVSLDTSVIRDGLIHKQLRSVVLRQRAALLGPGYLRVGGTAADSLLFDPSNEQTKFQNKSGDYEFLDDGSYSYEFLDGGSCSYEEFPCGKRPMEFIMSGQNWKDINDFTKSTGLKLIFDLNVLLRNETKWNSTNARELIKFSDEHDFDLVWQLGNEPNSFQHVFEITVSGQQLAEDFVVLKNLLDSFPRYSVSQLIGPDVTRPIDLQEGSLLYLSEFLSNIQNHTLSAITWHQYYVNGRIATEADFISPDILNILQTQIKAVKKVVDQFSPNVPIWLSETSSAYGGGAPGLSDRFLAGFLWLDKLGVAARMGIDVVVRQSLFQGHYALLDSNTFEPHPDWWLSVLFKTFVGRTVLSVGSELPQGPVRLYSHCTKSWSLSSSVTSMTIYGMNLKNETVHIQIMGFQTVPVITSYKSAYILTGEEELTSTSVLLNGKKLQLNPDGSLPQFIPVHSPISAPLTLPPFSMGFWVLHGVDIPACH